MLDLKLFPISLKMPKFGKKKTLNPVQEIKGTGKGWTQEIEGCLHLKGKGNRTLLKVDGPGALKIKGIQTIED